MAENTSNKMQNIASQPTHKRLARAYVPFQVYDRTYSPAEGLQKGTIFPELYMPYKKRM